MSDDKTLVARLRTEEAFMPVAWSRLVKAAIAHIEALEADNRNLRMELLAVLGQQIDAPPAQGDGHE